MKRFGLALLACVLLAGCKIYRLDGGASYRTIRAIYCPHAQTTTTYKVGKTTTSTSVIAE